MNILHHKSWHVRNKRNIERVRRDEKKALEEELEKERRRRLAESEVRLSVLRSNAREKRKDSTYVEANNRIDLFPEKSDPNDKRKNNEHEKETKKEQEEWEKKIGILTYLGQGMNEPDFEKPWYLESHSKRMKLDEINPKSKAAQKLADEDPLNEMNKIFTAMKKSKNK